MKTRLVRLRSTAVAAVGLSLLIMSPAWADCCSSILGCAATYVTDGLSCEIETLIDTLNTIATDLGNFIRDVDGKTQAAQQSARQSVSDTYNAMQSQSQQADADLAAALSQATALYKQETSIKPSEAQSIAQAQGQIAVPASGSSSPPRPQVEQRASSGASTGGPPRSLTAQRIENVAPASGAPNPLAQKSAVEVGTQVGGSPVVVRTPKGSFADAFSRAIQQIQTLKNAGDADFSNVNGHLQQALNSEGPGISQANTLAGVVDAPLTAIEATVSNMLTHPLSAFDPSSVVDSIENSVTADLSGNVTQMIADITSGPDDAFAAAQPAYDDLLAKAQAAQTLLAVMTEAYQQRTTAAANALYADLPSRQFQGLDTKNIAGSALADNNRATTFGQRIPYSVIAAKMSTAQQRAKAAYKPPNIDRLRVAIAQFKTQRAQGKSMPPTMLAGYKSRLAQQFDGYFTGKTPTAIASQRDQLISQARSQFAKDPSTANAVVGLLNSEASKRSSGVSASAAGTLPAQTMATGGAPHSAQAVNPPVGLGAAAVAPGALSATTSVPSLATRSAATLANPTVPAQPAPGIAMQHPTFTAIKPPAQAPAPIPQPPAATAQPANQVKTSVWGAAPVHSWAPSAAPAPSVATPPAPTPAATTVLKLQTVRPVQQPIQQTQPAPAAPTTP